MRAAERLMVDKRAREEEDEDGLVEGGWGWTEAIQVERVRQGEAGPARTSRSILPARDERGGSGLGSDGSGG